MAESPVLPTARSAPNLRPFGWFYVMLGAISVAASLLYMASFVGGLVPGRRFGTHELFLASGPAVLGALEIVNGIVMVRANRQNTALQPLLLAGFLLFSVGMLLQGA